MKMQTDTCDPHTVLSVVVPLGNDNDVLGEFLRELAGVLAGAFKFYEIILVDDGSADGTKQQVVGLLQELENVRYLRLSRRFGRDVAICAGLESSIGDFVVTMDPNTDPCGRIPELIQECRACGGVLHGLVERPSSRGVLRDIGGNWFRRYAKRRLGVELHRGSTDFRVFSRQVVNSLLQVPGRERYLRVFTSNIGFLQQTFGYQPLNRRQKVRVKPLGEEIGTVIDILTLNTRHPLRVVGLLGLCVACLNLLYMVYVVAIFFVKDKVAEGWTTTSLQLSGMFFFLFLLLSVMSEYVGALLGEVRAQPVYFIAEEMNSFVLLEDTVQTSVIQSGNQDTLKPHA